MLAGFLLRGRRRNQRGLLVREHSPGLLVERERDLVAEVAVGVAYPLVSIFAVLVVVFGAFEVSLVMASVVVLPCAQWEALPVPYHYYSRSHFVVH